MSRRTLCRHRGLLLTATMSACTHGLISMSSLPHCANGSYTTALSNEEVFAELYYARQIIKEVLGVTTKCW